MFNIVVIQKASDTGRFHPALYAPAPFPGEMLPSVTRYKSRMHHTEGFETESEAWSKARDLAEQVDADPGLIHVLDLLEAGPDVLILKR